MKRILGLLASTSLLLAIGCTYDMRLDKRIVDLRYQKQLDDNLEQPPEAKTNLAISNIYIRPPLAFVGPTKEIGLAPVEEGKFDIATSFIGDPASLHVLARVEKPKSAAPKKKGPNPTATPTTVRGDFTADVLEYIKGAYGTEAPKLKADPKKANNFKATTLDLTAKEVQIYILGEKNSPAQVALIFDYPKESRNSLTSKIKYCLESFRVGTPAQRLYSGQEEEGGEGATAPPGGVF
jgi:hypothetical protein